MTDDGLSLANVITLEEKSERELLQLEQEVLELVPLRRATQALVGPRGMLTNDSLWNGVDGGISASSKRDTSVLKISRDCARLLRANLQEYIEKLDQAVARQEDKIKQSSNILRQLRAERKRKESETQKEAAESFATNAKKQKEEKPLPRT
jgi:hypothetical protein